MTAAAHNPWPRDPYSDIPPPERAPDEPTRIVPPAGPALQFRTFGQLAADVDAAGPRRWLIRGIWPAGAYGVHAAEPKAGKTWNALDLAVSVATATPWLGQHPIDTSGHVVVFAGEGGDGNIVRRVRAIAAGRGITSDDMPISVCTRAPHLADDEHLAAMGQHLAATRPVLVVLDPFYLSAGGANGADLYAMGKLLEKPQHLCEKAGASLVVVTHFNRSRDLRGAARITGAGPAEWGRVLISAAVISRHSDPVTEATTVLTELDVQGGEVPDRTVRVRRTIRALDPDDLDSALEYRVDEPTVADPTPVGPGADLSQAAAKLLAALDAQETPQAYRILVDHVAATHGHGLTRQTCSKELNQLRQRGIADYLDLGAGRERLWYRVRTETPNP
ncbi:AAA family ATPase [Blastococcus sp. TBT05-19]|uniref:AAA family ATPase n=1 Tax=Blastococcus sp. TBT05-19 TaxID=2250581 RepID=UPI0013143D1F|nr:AAA family ATPase [Blastococcus sp. TBT05-19]